FTPEGVSAYEREFFFEGVRRRPHLVRFSVLLFLATVIASGGIVELTPHGRDVAQNKPLAELSMLLRRLRDFPQERLVEIDDVLLDIIRQMTAEIEA
ncbi:MAG: hypothetical protein WA996_04150, partial [Candidatus Promineifilaceae bacterium]